MEKRTLVSDSEGGGGGIAEGHHDRSPKGNRVGAHVEDGRGAFVKVDEPPAHAHWTRQT